MKPRNLHKQSGVALIAVMFVIVIAMVVMPSIMSRSSFVQGLSAKQLFQLKNAIKAEEVNHMLHAVVGSSLNNSIAWVEAGFSPTTEPFACAQRISTLGDCQTTVSKLKITDSVEVFRCLSSVSNVSEVRRMQHITCVHGPSNDDAAISVWSYIKGDAVYVKVKEESF